MMNLKKAGGKHIKTIFWKRFNDSDITSKPSYEISIGYSDYHSGERLNVWN
jgi:hypothetical protein